MQNIELEFRAWDESQKYMAYQGTPDLIYENPELLQKT